MNSSHIPFVIITCSVLFTLSACHTPSSPPPPTVIPEAVIHLAVPQRASCDGVSDQAMIQAALDQAPAKIILAPGRYCLDGPLTVRSHSHIQGAGDGRDGEAPTLLQQTRPSAAAFHLNSVENVTIRELKIQLHPKISQAADGDDCPRNPIADTLCMWQRASAITAHDTRHIRIERTTLIGGRAGIALLDHPRLSAPSGGPQAEVIALDANEQFDIGWEIRDDTCTEGDTPRNRHWSIEHNRIEGAQDGILVYNLNDSLIRANTIRAGQRFNGIKIGCGPVTANHLIANYLHGNGLGGVGDGIDVAWAWSAEEKIIERQGQRLFIRHREDPPDGPFRGNLIEGNLAWNNLGNGLALKVKQNDQGCGDYRTNPLYQIGSNTIRRNAAWENGKGGTLRGDPPLATTSQLELRCIQPQGGARLEVSGNVLTGRLPPLTGLGAGGEAPFPIAIIHPHHGATLDRIWHSDYHDNWHRGLFDLRTAPPQAWDLFIAPAALSPAADNHFHALHARPEAISSPGLTPELPDASSLMALLSGVAQTHGYHCRDDDHDVCPNICEALGGRNHLSDEGEGSCDCQPCNAPPQSGAWR